MENWKIISERWNVLHFHNVHDLTYCIYWGRHLPHQIPLKSLVECIGFMFGFQLCLNIGPQIQVVFLIFLAKIRDRWDRSIEFDRSTFWTRRLRLPRQLPRHAGGERWIGLARILQVQVDPRRVVLIQNRFQTDYGNCPDFNVIFGKVMNINEHRWKFQQVDVCVSEMDFKFPRWKVQLSILPSRSAADGSETVMKGLTKSTVVTWVEGEEKQVASGW